MPARRTPSESSEETVQTCPSRSSQHRRREAYHRTIQGLPFTRDPYGSSSSDRYNYNHNRYNNDRYNYNHNYHHSHNHYNSHNHYHSHNSHVRPRQPMMPTPSAISMASTVTEVTAPARTHAYRLHEDASKTRTSYSIAPSDHTGTASSNGGLLTLSSEEESYSIKRKTLNDSSSHSSSSSPPRRPRRLPDAMPPPQERSQDVVSAHAQLPVQGVPATTDAAAAATNDTVFIEVQPNLKVPLRRVPEVLKALQAEYYDTPNCPSCNKQVVVVADAAFVHCPLCAEISPLFGTILPVGKNRGGGGEQPEYLRYGLALGMTWETMKKVHAEMVAAQGATTTTTNAATN